MNKEEVKLSDKELHKAIDNLKGTQFLDAFCILDWIIKTRDENEQLQQKVKQLKTNRDEAIKYIKNNIQEGYSEVFEAEMRWDAVSGDDLLSILERGKE